MCSFGHMDEDDNNCDTHGFVKKYVFLNEGFHFLRINVLQLKVGFFSLFQCEMKPIHKT